MGDQNVFTRRQFLASLAVAGGAGLLAACGGGAAPASAPASASSGAPKASSSGPASSAAASGSAPATKPSASASGSGAADKMKFAASSSVSSAGTYIGLDRGYFKELGIDVEIVQFNSAADMIPAIAASQVDAANADTGAGIFNALGRDLPMRFVADGNRTEKGHSSLAWVVRKDLIDNGSIKDLPDLKGKKISPIAKGSLVDSLAYRTLEKAGLKDSDVNIQYITFPDVLPAFQNKNLDAAILVEPLVTAAVDQKLGVRWRDMYELFGEFQSTLIIYSPTLVTSRHDVANRFMVGYVRGLRDYLDAFDKGKDFDTIVPILTKYTNIKDPALFKKITVPGFDPNGQMDVASIKALQQWYVSHGFVKTPVNLDKIFDTSYLDAALKVVGRR